MISSTDSLDKERRDQYTLIITATDTASPPNTASTTLTVIVRDENDNPPTFLLAPYFFEITEEEAGVVVRLNAVHCWYLNQLLYIKYCYQY